MRILVVEDFAPFRRWLYSILQNRPEFQVILEVADGLEAVQEAANLQPELVLLDIGLPGLNGIEAARQIRQLSPKSKILFVSQETSVDVVQEALRIGARGYVVKSDAGRDLLTAINAVLQGDRFVSQSINEMFPALSLQSAEIARRHEVEFYSDDRCFLDDLTQFVGAALKAGSAAIVVATEPHRDGLIPRLQASGLDIGAAIEQGRYIALDAAETLSTFMVNDMLDPERFLELFGSLIATAAGAAKGEQVRVAVFGECVQLLWAQGNREAAIQMERLGNQLTKTYDVDILCSYSLGSFRGEQDSHDFERICAEHSAVHYQTSTGV